MIRLAILLTAILGVTALPQSVDAAPKGRAKAAGKTTTPAARAKRAKKATPKTRTTKLVVPKQTTAAAKNSIDIKAKASDPTMKVEVGAGNTLTISGRAHGPTDGRDMLGPLPGVYAKSVSFTLDIDKARTTDVFGRKNYKLKNQRMFQVSTQPGWTAGNIADRLAVKVNGLRDFRATVTHHNDGTATMAFTAR